MKKLIVIVPIFLMCSLQAQKSSYFPFPDSNAMWNIHYLLYSGPYTQEMMYSIKLSGDTIISGLTFHKLNIPHVYVIPSDAKAGIHAIAEGYQGAIRQDIINRKVFIVPPGSDTEQLLYDFNMQVGDTVKGYLETYCNSDVVTSIDSVMVGADYHRRWKIGNLGYEDFYIEGIGYNYGLIMFSPCQIVDMANITITCFLQDGSTLYPDTSMSCDVITRVNPPINPIILNKVYPNPSNGSLTIEPAEGTGLIRIRIANMFGEVIREEHANGQKKIMLEPLPAGIYILTITDSRESSTNVRIAVID